MPRLEQFSGETRRIYLHRQPAELFVTVVTLASNPDRWGERAIRVSVCPHPAVSDRESLSRSATETVRGLRHRFSLVITVIESLAMTLLAPQKKRTTLPRTAFRLVLGAFLLLAGISHLTINRQAFLAQVPSWLPVDGDLVVVASGIVEIVLGVSLLALGRYRVQVGWIVAAFFVAVFPGNISQLAQHTDSFGLNTDLARAIRLLFQPVLVLWALWSSGAWLALREYRARRRTERHRAPPSG